MMITSLTILNLYRLRSGSADFVTAIRALAARVQLEGHPGVMSYRFFVNADEGLARAVIDYKDASAWIGHHDIAMDWPEMTALHATAALIEVTFLGPLSDEIRAWIAGSKLSAEVHGGYESAAEFRLQH